MFLAGLLAQDRGAVPRARQYAIRLFGDIPIDQLHIAQLVRVVNQLSDLGARSIREAGR